jgi:hypothetical protein
LNYTYIAYYLVTYVWLHDNGCDHKLTRVAQKVSEHHLCNK